MSIKFDGKKRKSAPALSLILVWALAVGTMVLSLVKPVRAQEVTASITGTVADPTDAPVPGATVTAKDVDRGVTYPAETDAAGVYYIPHLPVGTYDVTVEAKGFASALRKGITLQLDQRARLDVRLALGTVTQVVEVTGSAPLLHTDSMQLDTVITSKINEELPLATRNYVQLTLLAPGSVNPNPGSFTGPQTTAASGRPYVNGNREQSDNFMLDGVDNNQASDNLVGYTPSEDAIQEFSMITNNASAEFGNFQGAIINTTIKSGTNQLHGDAFEFFRNDVLNAANWGSNYQIPHVDKGKLRWNEFGATVGGPIRKDKLFYFGDYQGERWDSPASAGRATVFTDKERAGDFSEICQTGFTAGLCNPAPAGSGLLAIQLYNPFQVTSGNRAPIPNNNLAAAGLTIDPVANKLFTSSFYPAQIPGFGARNGLQSNQLNTTRSETVGDQFDVKLDYTLSEKDRISGRYSQSRSASPNFNSFALFFNGFYNTPTRSTVIDWTRNINPAMVNEARVGFNYVKLNNGGADNGLGNVGTTLGIPGANDRGPGLPSICGFTYVSCIGNSNIGTQQLFADTSIPFSDDMTITHGRHIFHSGFQLIRSRIDTFYAGNYGRTGGISFNGQYTAGPSGSATSGTVGCTSGTPPCVPTSAANPPFSLTIGFPEADFWLGFPNDIQRGVDTGTWGQRSNMYAGYFQDDWRATDNLTVNLGLRYETHTPWVEVRDRQANFGLISGTEYFAGKSGCPYSNCRALYNSYNGGFDFQPRLGFAWTPGFLGKAFVVRGAYSASSYLEGTGTNLRLPLNPPFAEEHNTIYNPGDPSSIGNSTDNGFTVLTSPTDPFANAVIRLWNPDVKPSLAQQWNLSAEHQFGNATVLSIGYVGQNATHLMNPMPYFQRRLVGEAGCNSENAVLFKGAPIPTCASPYLSGNPALANISQISGTESNADMWYHGLQATLKRRFNNGLQYQVAYTYSHCMTNSIGYYGSWGGQVVPTAAYWQNLYDSHSEWGYCESDVTHLLSSYAVYELPFGRQKKYGSSWNAAQNGLLGDWQVSGILQLHGGYPSTPFASDNSFTYARTSRAYCTGPAHYPQSSYAGGGIQWVDPSPFTSSGANGTFGSCGVATVRGPGLHTFDLGLQKEIPIAESKHLEFRAEFINFTNTPILNAPGMWAGGGFGVVGGSQGERNIQFGLKLFY